MPPRNGTGGRHDPGIQFDQLVASIDGIVWEADPRTFQFLFVSQQAERLLGYPLEQWLRPGFWVEQLHPEDRDWAVEFCRQATRDGRKHDFEYRMIAADGRTLWLRDIVSLVAEAGTVSRLCGVMVDVTEHKRTQEALRQREADLKLALEAGRMGEWKWNIVTGEIVWGPLCKALYGLPHDAEITYERFLAAVHPDDRERVEAALKRAVETGADYEIEKRVVWPDGSVRWNASRGRVYRDAGGRPSVMAGMTMDVTERKQAEEALRKSQEQLQLAVEATGLGSWDWDLRTNEAVLSPELKRQLGYEEQGISGRYEEWEGRLHPDDRERVRDAVRGYLEGRRPEYAVEYRLRHRDGSYRWIHTRGVVLRDAGGQPLRLLGFNLDVTERKRAEQALIESHGLLHAVIEGTTDAVFVKDFRGHYLMANSAAARFLGRSVGAALGKDDQELFGPEAARRLRERDRQVIATGEPQLSEEVAPTAGAAQTYLTTRSPFRDAQGRVIGVIGIARDITELKRLEQQFRQAQKMEAVGRLAGGVAHDFNNLLTVINGYSDLALSGLGANDSCREMVAEIRKAGERAASLIHQLLAFSRKQVLQPQVVNLNALLVQLHKMLQRLIGEDVELTLSPDPALGLTEIDPGQFEQAVINLAVNARDAMPQGGRLTIATGNADLDLAYAESHPEARPGGYVLVVVSDTGVGMDEATRARLFEPFFTTKGPGKGTGLGLPMVYGFVKQSGGHVEVDSEPGRGTTFKVYMPRAGALPPSAKTSAGALEAPRGTETVLLVEDEDSVRALVKLVLQSSGYTIVEARDGEEGLRVAQKHPGPIHLLLSDLVMPRMGGRQLADLLAPARPQMRILFMSGYTSEAVLHHGVTEAGVAFLPKPFSPISLARKVRELLDTKPA